MTEWSDLFTQPTPSGAVLDAQARAQQPTPQPVYSGSLLPLTRYDDGSVGFDSNAGIVGALKNALTSAPAIGQGPRYGTVTDGDDTADDVGRAGAAANLASMFAGSAAPIPKPADSIGIFGGRLAKTANQGVADLTEQALAKGATDQQGWDAGGWFKGVDGKLRFEIPDSGAVYRGTGATVGDAIDHPALFAAYPDMARIPFTAVDLGPSRLGSMSSDGLAVNSTFPPEQQRSTMLHELQHYVQEKENFARGGSAERTPGWSTDEVFDAYKALSGEVESRNVQARAQMTPDQLRATPPWETMDTPYLNQNPHFTTSNGQSAGLEPPRLLNGQSMTPDQMRQWLYGELRPGSMPGGFAYP